jgi:hypothetical protein
LGLFFGGEAERNIGVTLSGIGGCIGFGLEEIGFVLQKRGQFVEEALQV